MTRQSRPGQAASIPGRSRNPLLSTQAQSPHGQSEPSMRRPHESTEKLSGFCSFLPFSYEPCFHTHSMKSRLGPMQKGFLIQGLVLLSVPTGSKAQDSRRSHQKNKTVLFSFQQKVFWFCVWLSFISLRPPPPLFSQRTADRSFCLPRVGAITPPACVPPPQSPASSHSCHHVQPTLSPIL